MDSFPARSFMVDPKQGKIAVHEARKTGDPDRGHRGYQL